jgi:hypothetical protein
MDPAAARRAAIFFARALPFPAASESKGAPSPQQARTTAAHFAAPAVRSAPQRIPRRAPAR